MVSSGDGVRLGAETCSTANECVLTYLAPRLESSVRAGSTARCAEVSGGRCELAPSGSIFGQRATVSCSLPRLSGALSWDCVVQACQLCKWYRDVVSVSA